MIIIDKSASNPSNILPSEITPRPAFENRRDFLLKAGLGLLAGSATLLSTKLQAANIAGGVTEGAGRLIGRANAPATLEKKASVNTQVNSRQKINGYSKTAYGAGEKLTKYEDITTYNNYYEFGTDKADPAKNAGTLVTKPWTVAIEGLVKQPKSYTIEDLIKLSAQEERIYRLRCVEGWSMVIPWVGLWITACNDVLRHFLSNLCWILLMKIDDRRNITGNIISKDFLEQHISHLLFLTIPGLARSRFSVDSHDLRKVHP